MVRVDHYKNKSGHQVNGNHPLHLLLLRPLTGLGHPLIKPACILMRRTEDSILWCSQVQSSGNFFLSLSWISIIMLACPASLLYPGLLPDSPLKHTNSPKFVWCVNGWKFLCLHCYFLLKGFRPYPLGIMSSPCELGYYGSLTALRGKSVRW